MLLTSVHHDVAARLRDDLDPPRRCRDPDRVHRVIMAAAGRPPKRTGQASRSHKGTRTTLRRADRRQGASMAAQPALPSAPRAGSARWEWVVLGVALALGLGIRLLAFRRPFGAIDAAFVPDDTYYTLA